MNERVRFKFNEKLEDRGLPMEMLVEFIPCKDNPNEMEILQCIISLGCRSMDYGFVVRDTTLLDVIKEFAEYYYD